MKRIFIEAAFLSFLSMQLACWGSSADDSNVSTMQNGEAELAQRVAGEYADANLALADGTKLLDTGETEKAIEVLNQAVKLNPDLAEAYFKLGIAYALVEMRDAEVVKAEITPISDAKQKKPRETKTNSEKAFEKAVEAYKKMLAANPEDHAAHFNLGLAYNKLNEDEDAAKSLREAVKLNPEDTEYQTELGAILIKLAKYRDAIPSLKKALELDPSNIEAEELLADAEAGRKRVDYVTVKKEEKKLEKSEEQSNSNTQMVEPGATPTPPASPEKKSSPTAKKPAETAVLSESKLHTP